jgi:nitrite reductase (NO-forming)
MPVPVTTHAPSAAPSGRAGWHRRVSALPTAYLVGLVVLAFAHPFLPSWRWLAIHLLLLGAVTNAIVVWSAHFTVAVLRAPAPASRRAETVRLAALNVGVLSVLAGGAVDLPWLGVAGAAVLFSAVATHLRWLAVRLRTALPTRFAVTVRYYPPHPRPARRPGGLMLVVDDATRPRLLFHAHVNLLGYDADCPARC